MNHKVIPSHYFTVKEQSLVSLVCQGKRRFIIPFNQRPWSWKNRNIEELWNDILKTSNGFFHANDFSDSWNERVSPISDPHFIGAFVFEEKDNDLSVVDGQQRLTSITMFVAALRNETESLLNSISGSLKKTVQYFLDNFKSWLIADFSDDKVFTRLKIEEKYDDFFVNYIIEGKTENDRSVYLEENEIDLTNEPVLLSIKKSFDYVSALVSDYLNKIPDPKQRYKAIKVIFSTLEECFICISADVKRESFSYDVFKCLNAKGLPLSEADKLKNELFTQSDLKDHEEIKKYWDSISERTPYNAVSAFIRQRYVALYGDCPDSKLHSVITEHELKNKEILHTISEWAKDSEIFARVSLINLESGIKAYNEKELKYLKDLQALNIGLASILTFAGHKKYFKVNRDDFLEILRLTRNFCFRALTVCKKDTGYLESILGKSARMVISGETVKVVRQFIRNSTPDAEFKEHFINFSARTASLQFYVLREFELNRLDKFGLVPNSHGDDLNVEHIMPKKFDIKNKEREDEWISVRNEPELHKNFLNRIGNLCLLEGEINRDVSSFDYVAKVNGSFPKKFQLKRDKTKRLCYADSKMSLVIEIIEKYKSWDFDSIVQRQTALAEEALEIWKI